MTKVPSTIDLMYPSIEAIRALGGSATTDEIYQWLVDTKKYSKEILEIPHNDRISEVRYRTGWAQTRLKRIGAITKKEGKVWLATVYGMTAKKDAIIKSTKEDYKKLNKKYPLNKKTNKTQTPTIVSDELENNNLTYDEKWKDELLDTIKNITPEQFERLTGNVLRRAGFSKVKVTQSHKDGGIDGEGFLRVNLISFHVMFQCKRYNSAVGGPAIQQFRGAISNKVDRGLFITTGNFTSAAEKEARGTPAIDLINGDKFCELLKEHEIGVSVEMVEDVTIDKKFFEDF